MACPLERLIQCILSIDAQLGYLVTMSSKQIIKEGIKLFLCLAVLTANKLISTPERKLVPIFFLFLFSYFW